MLEKLLNDPLQAAQGALDGLSLRHAAISENIANVDTPGYKRKEVPFEQALARSLRNSSAGCSGNPCRPNAPFVPQVVRDSGSEMRTDGNNVDVEREMVQLTDNTLRYETLAQAVGGFFTGLKSVINSGV